MASFQTSPLPPSWKLWLVGLVSFIAFFLILSGPILKPLSSTLKSGRPKLEAVVLDVNGRRVELTSGQSIVLRPLDHLRVVRIKTSLFSEKDLRLEGVGFEARPLWTGVKISDLLPVTAEPASYPLEVSKGPQILGRISLVPVVMPVDWALLAAQVTGQARLTLLQKALSADPNNVILLDQIQRTARHLGRMEEAAAALAVKLKIAFSLSELATLAQLYRELGATDDEAEILNRLAALEPDNPAWAEQLLNLAEASHDQELTVTALEKLAKGPSKVRSAEASKKLGYTLAQAGRWAEAAAAYEKAAEIDPQDANVFQNLSVIYDKLGQKDKYRQALEALARLRPEDVTALKELARTAGRQEAPAAWERVLERNPNDEEALIKLIKLYQPAGPSDKLARLYGRLAAIKATDPVPYYNQGLTLFALGRHAEAEQALAQAHAFAPKDPDILSALLEAQRRQGSLGPAMETAQKLLDLKPKELEIYRFLFDELTKRGQKAELEKILVKGVKAVPKSAELWNLLALTRLSRQNVAGAAQALARAVALEPDNINNRLRLAKLLEAAGQTKEAMLHYQAILERQPDHQEAGKAYLRLKFELLKKKK